jgi:hypothetical protein
MIYTGSGHDARNTLHLVRACSLLRRIGLYNCVYKGGALYLSLYRAEGRGTNLVLIDYNRRVLVLLEKLTFLVSRLGRSLIT